LMAILGLVLNYYKDFSSTEDSDDKLLNFWNR
jgi:hypothetical protein